MAQGDLYDLRWRTEQGGVVMNNGVLYQQSDSDIGAYGNPALALLEAIKEGGNNVLAYWRLLGSDEASITCAIAEKVLDVSQTGPDEAILFDVVYTSVQLNAMAPSQCCTVDMWTNGDSSDKANRRYLYLGGLSEDIMTGIGLSEAVSDSMRTNSVWLLNPELGLTDLQPFRAVLPIKPKESLFPFRTVTRANPPHYLTRKNSRRLRLCV